MHQLCVLKNVKGDEQISCEFCDTVTYITITRTYWIVVFLCCLYSHVVAIAEIIFYSLYVFPHASARTVPIAIDIFTTANVVLLLLAYFIKNHFSHVITTTQLVFDGSLLLWLFTIATICGIEGDQLSNVTIPHLIIIVILCFYVFRLFISLWLHITLGIRFLCYDVRPKEN